jgi:hypothetical protein
MTLQEAFDYSESRSPNVHGPRNGEPTVYKMRDLGNLTAL